jgi:acetoin utilization deacetylase AcuC-like enzyme
VARHRGGARALAPFGRGAVSACAWITHPECLGHDNGEDHPECAGRIHAISDYLIATRLMPLLVPCDAPLATDEQLGRAHATAYLREMESLANAAEPTHVDPDTLFGPGTLAAARRAAGAAVLATDHVVRGDVPRAFCAVRPPGHHATRSAAMGFCIFNNVAVGIRHALAAHGIERVALADFDAHHGNGSEDILAGDDRVLMVSTFERDLYPFQGEVPLAANMANVPLEPRSGREALEEAFESVWRPRLDEFRPQLLFISAGFDAHRADDMSSLRWVEDDYAWITRRLVEVAERHCGGRIVSCLEGGYHPFHLARSVAAHVRELAGAG